MGGAGQRKRFFVDRQVQGAIVCRLLTHWIFACGLMALYLFCLEILARGMEGRLSDHFQATWQRYAPLFVVVGTLFPVFVYDSIRLSHRFAGPMVSLKRNLKRLADNQAVEPLRFRKGDYWHELSADLNRVAETMGLSQPHRAEQDSV